MKKIIRCDTKSLDEFAQLASIAADVGATHVFISDLPKSRWQWERDLADPYPNWGMMHASIFKVIVPPELQEWLPADYAAANLELISRRCEILRQHGLKAAFSGCEPGWLPEEVYRAHPEWRGPRNDHTRRARTAYHSPCIDHPQVLAMYRRAIAELCQAAPIELFSFLTNDSGGGICWSQGLYPGPNGPAACRHRSLSDRIVGFLDTVQAGAADAGLQAEVTMNGSIPSWEADGLAPALHAGQSVQGRTATGRALTVVAGSLGDFYGSNVYPVRGIPQPIKFVQGLEQMAKAPDATRVYGLPSVDAVEIIELLRRDAAPRGLWQRWQLLHDVAVSLVGEAHAETLLEAWDEISRYAGELAHMDESGPILLLGGVNQRWITRPFVPFPLELSPEETAYYRRFQFQANSEEEAADLMDLQGIWMVKGFSGRYLAETMFTRAISHARAARKAVDTLAGGVADEAMAARMRLLSQRLQVLTCLMRNALHACQYQEILDRTDFSQAPVETPIWHVPADQRGFEIQAIARREIDNTYELINLLQSAAGPLLYQADTPDKEDIFLLGPELVEQLERKIRIMLDHQMDYNRLYARFN